LLLVLTFLVDEGLVELVVEGVGGSFGGAVEAKAANDKSEAAETDNEGNHDGHDVRSGLSCSHTVVVVVVHEAGLGLHQVGECVAILALVVAGGSGFSGSFFGFKIGASVFFAVIVVVVAAIVFVAIVVVAIVVVAGVGVSSV